MSGREEVHDQEGDWQVDWGSHRRRQLTTGLEATPAQRLAWFEEVIVLAYRSGALRASIEQPPGAPASHKP
jgi:hypothetical protein